MSFDVDEMSLHLFPSLLFTDDIDDEQTEKEREREREKR